MSSLPVAATVVSADTTTEPGNLRTGLGAALAVGTLAVLAAISGPLWGLAGTVKLLKASAISVGPAAAGWVTQHSSGGVQVACCGESFYDMCCALAPYVEQRASCTDSCSMPRQAATYHKLAQGLL